VTSLDGWLGLQRTPNTRDVTFLIVMSVSFVLGMAVALILVYVWLKHPGAISQSATYHIAVALCPPFLLVGVMSALTDSPLAVVLTAGTIVFANGPLYAGLSAFAYWVLSNLRPQGKA
jgi:hypothetical protein